MMIKGMLTISLICAVMLITMLAVELIWRDDEEERSNTES